MNAGDAFPNAVACRRGRRRPQLLIGAAFVVLLAALGGTSYAALSAGGAPTLRSRSAAFTHPHQLPVASAHSAAVGAVKLIYESSPTETIAANGLAGWDVTCPQGDYAVGGGVGGGNGKVFVQDSLPWNSTGGWKGIPNAWDVYLDNTDATGSQTVSIVVVCAVGVSAQSTYN